MSVLNLLSSAPEPADQPGELRWCLVNFLAYFVVAYPSDPCGLGGGGGMLIDRTSVILLASWEYWTRSACVDL